MFKTFLKWILEKSLLSGFLLEKEEVQLLQDFLNPPVSKNYTTETSYGRKINMKISTILKILFILLKPNLKFSFNFLFNFMCIRI